MSQKCIRALVYPEHWAPFTYRTDIQPPLRGAIYASSDESCPYVRSVPYFEYRFDPVEMTNSLSWFHRKDPSVIPDAKRKFADDLSRELAIDHNRAMQMVMTPNYSNRYQFVTLTNVNVLTPGYCLATNSAGLIQRFRAVRQYLYGRQLSHVLGGIGQWGEAWHGLECRFDKELKGKSGYVMKHVDARQCDIPDRRVFELPPVNGVDIYLTINRLIQKKAEIFLKKGMQEYGAGAGWCIVMDSRTGAILAMASLPDYDPREYMDVRKNKDIMLNRAIGFNYEPGSVMKVITVASAIDAGFVTKNTLYSSDRKDSRYYRLPGDGSHDWVANPRMMSVEEAIVHSSNIIIGKLGYDFGPHRLWTYLHRFGFGQNTYIELPGEQHGILRNPSKVRWDKGMWSRVPIGQAVSVTALQLVSAYQAIANDGVRMPPHIVDRIVSNCNDTYKESRAVDIYKHPTEPIGRPISAKTARIMREIMLDVASSKGTARQAAIRGYSVAGKTGTAQKSIPNGKGYFQGLYYASFCGIVPATEPRLVVLVTLDFQKSAKYHQGGNSAAPIFKRIAMVALHHLAVPPDKPEEIVENDGENEFEKIISECE